MIQCTSDLGEFSLNYTIEHFLDSRDHLEIANGHIAHTTNIIDISQFFWRYI